MPAAIPNEMILASAGSGKTWQLTNRFIALMGQQLLAGREVRPERIIAVTFTRKAAGEFFDSILSKLARAASDEDFARSLAGDPTLDPESRNDPLRPILSQLKQRDYQFLLRRFVSLMPRLFLGTLDSFFSSILRSFPAEFGLAGDFEILNDHQGTIEREQVYRRVFQRSLPGLRARNDRTEAQKEFLEAFRRATFGREEASIRSVLDQFVENQHGILLHAAREELWGNPEAIWPKGCRWLGPKVDLHAAFEQLNQRFQAEGVHEAVAAFWDQFRDEAVLHVPGNALPARTDYFIERLLPVWDKLDEGNVELTVNRKKQKLDGTTGLIVKAIVRQIVGGELTVRLERTRGVWQVLSLFEQQWSRQVRRHGRLTFQDMELILAGHEFGEDMPRPMLSQVPGEDARLRIDYRLDARYEHWLLDEFQDTNYMQWSVIENLIDETVQDASDERTLFQVGDVKQAIYAWRGGDTRLFQDIADRYNSGAEPRIHERPLNVSWRSGHDVIEMVNRVFGNRDAFSEMSLPEEARARWKWSDHLVAGVNETLPGYAVFMNPEPSDGEKVVEEDRFALTVGVLEEVQPVARGLSCAILVQENKIGRALVEYIRAHSSIPVMSESEVPVAIDNPVTLALLSLIQFAAHPGDTMAWQHLCMTPFKSVFDASQINPGWLAASVLRQVFDHGFEFTLSHWMRELMATSLTLDAFSQRRVEDLLLAARLFDQGGSRHLDEFLAYAGSYTVREPNTRNAVQVMTIHKSKGLTFDCVILPDLEGQSMSMVRRGIGVKRDDHRHVQWVFDLPPSDVVKADPVLATYREEREADAAYEELCKFYVALTRAKHANYVIASPRSEKSRSNNFIKLLDLCLAGDEAVQTSFSGVPAQVLYASEATTACREWFARIASKSAPPETAAVNVPPIAEGRTRPARRTPSGSETAVVTAKQLFSRGGRFARAYGTLVHAMFEQIEWLGETDDSALEQAWARVPCPDDSVRSRALDEVRTCLGARVVRDALSRPSLQAVCWREKRFEILLRGEWLSGTFDRVVLEPDRATILDFKTDKIESPTALEERIEGYRPQLLTYREVLAKMTSLPVSAITCKLLFTHRREVITVV